MWDKIKDCMDDHTYMGVIDRDKYRVKATAEVFTPTDLVIRMLKKSNIHDYAPGKTVLDPACGDGQFLTAIKWIKVFAFNMSEEEALTIVGTKVGDLTLFVYMKIKGIYSSSVDFKKFFNILSCGKKRIQIYILSNHS